MAISSGQITITALIDGVDGVDGDFLVNVIETLTSYRISDQGVTVPEDGTFWLDNVPAINPREFLWVKTISYYSDGTSVTAYSVAQSGEIAIGGVTEKHLAANSVTADKILADSIGTNHLAANSVTTRALLAGSVDTPQLAANAVTAEKILAGALDAFVITAPVIQTKSDVSQGIKLNSTGLIGFDGSGAKKFELTPAGNLTISGTITGSTITGSTVTGGTLQTQTEANRGIKLTSAGLIGYDGSGNEKIKLTTAGVLTVNGGTITGAVVQDTTSAVGTGTGIRLSGAKLSIWDENNKSNVTIDQHDISIWGNGTPWVNGKTVSSLEYDRLTVGATWNKASQVYDNEQFFANKNTAGLTDSTRAARAYLSVSGGASGLFCPAWGGNPEVRLILAEFRANLNTSTAAANMTTVGGTNNLICRTGSLRKYKLDIQDGDMAWADRVLQLRPRTWLDKGEFERIETHPENFVGNRIPGFVAEEVEEADLKVFCQYDPEGNLYGVAYDRIPAALVMLAQKQQNQIELLTTRIGELEKETNGD